MKSVNSDIAYDYIRKRILSGEYSAGLNLSTNTLSAEIGISRTPVHDALRQLEADGLVTIKSRIGASVKTMDISEFREMCGLRLALESYAAGLAAVHRTEEDLREISVALEAMRVLTEKIVESAEEEPWLLELRQEDVRFHIAIMTAAKNGLVKKEILRLHLINRVVSSPPKSISDPTAARIERDDRRRSALTSHQEIYEAIRDGDISGAKSAMEAHIQEIVDINLRAMSKEEARKLTEDELIYSA